MGGLPPPIHIEVFEAPGGSLGPSGGSLGAFREASGGLRGDPGELLGASWGLLGRFVAQEAPKNRETRSEDTARTRLRGPRWPPEGPQEGPTYPQEGPKTVPKGFENDIQEKKTKTSKSTTLSTEKLDF